MYSAFAGMRRRIERSPALWPKSAAAVPPIARTVPVFLSFGGLNLPISPMFDGEARRPSTTYPFPERTNVAQLPVLQRIRDNPHEMRSQRISGGAAARAAARHPAARFPVKTRAGAR